MGRCELNVVFQMKALLGCTALWSTGVGERTDKGTVAPGTNQFLTFCDICRGCHLTLIFIVKLFLTLGKHIPLPSI